MTIDAPPHVVDVVDLEDLGHARDIAMAAAARIRPHRLDMQHVGETGVACERMHPHPFNRFLFVVSVPHLLDLGSIPGSDDSPTE
jgi:hypothetical protein